MTELSATISAANSAFKVSSMSADMRFGSPLRGMGCTYAKADNSTDGVTRESLLRDLRAVQARDDALLGPTEKALLVILERIVDGGVRDEG